MINDNNNNNNTHNNNTNTTNNDDNDTTGQGRQPGIRAALRLAGADAISYFALHYILL